MIKCRIPPPGKRKVSMPDLVIKNADVIDGTGADAFRSDLAVSSGMITHMDSDIDMACDHVIDGSGLVVSPGFIDIHTHSDFTLLLEPMAESRVRQGVTTEVTGNCGGSPGPILESGQEAFMEYMTDLGKYYRLYRKLMKHRRKTLRIPIHELNYEDMVQDQEQETRKLLAFCGIEWNDACLDFHNTQRTVSTASYEQVRKPMYTKSIGRWRDYEKHLGPLIDELNKPD